MIGELFCATTRFRYRLSDRQISLFASLNRSHEFEREDRRSNGTNWHATRVDRAACSSGRSRFMSRGVHLADEKCFNVVLMGGAVKTWMFHRKYLQSECSASLVNIGLEPSVCALGKVGYREHSN